MQKQNELQDLERTLGHHFGEAELLARALTHRSHAAGGCPEPRLDNDRLEFLGDSVLGLVVSHYLAVNFPEWNSGMLSKAKATLVSAASIVSAAQSLRLGQHLRLGRGEEMSGGREKRNLLADAYEAIIAAIYLDAGLPAASHFIERTLLGQALTAIGATLEHADYKSALQEWLQQRGRGPAEYRVVKETGPEHRKIFSVELWLEAACLAGSQGASKKEAEQGAARDALSALKGEPEARQESDAKSATGAKQSP